MVKKCENCRYETVFEYDEGVCADCFGFSEWKPKKEVKEEGADDA